MTLPNNEAKPVNVSFKVIDNDSGDGIENATVKIGDVTGTTGSAGGCTLRNILTGEATCEVTANGYNDYNQVITVVKNNPTITIRLTKN